MRIWPICVNKFFPEKATGRLVCLGCEQYGDKNGNPEGWRLKTSTKKRAIRPAEGKTVTVYL